MRHSRTLVVVLIIVLASLTGLTAQSGHDQEASWNAFLAWLKTASIERFPLLEYGDKLRQEGKGEAEIRQQVALLTRLIGERSDWIGIHYDKVYTRPVTGDPETDGFNSYPSALVADSIKGLKPGSALDAGIGQGRNAVFLAEQGWTVTGFDVSQEALAASQANARKAGVRVTTVNASYEAFDFGANRWDLIVLAFAWAPLDDPAFVERLRASLRPAGRVVVEHFIQAAGGPQPNVVRKLAPNQLRRLFEGFEMAFYEEAEGVGDWGGPGSQLVRMVAVKR